jgi:hypothetical protein
MMRVWSMIIGAIAGGVLAPASAAQQNRYCLAGPRALHFLEGVRARVSPANPEFNLTVPAKQVVLIVDDSICAAVSRTLGRAITVGYFPQLDRQKPFPIIVVRAGPSFFVHDAEPDTLEDRWPYGREYWMMDTLRPPPQPGYVLPLGCWEKNCCPNPWTLRTPLTLRRAPSLSAPALAQLPVNAEVNADSGFALVDTIGLIVVERPVWNQSIWDTLPPGDTLYTVFWGEANDVDPREYLAWWRGLITRVDLPKGTGGARSVREPHWQPWVRVIHDDGRKKVRGWALMTGDVEVTGPNCHY